MSDQAQTPTHTPTALSDESFADIFESSQSLVKEGQVVTGTVLSVDPEFVLVDVGCKSEGMIATWEFADDDGIARIEVGQKVEVLVEQSENDDGVIVLSKEKADRLRHQAKATWRMARPDVFSVRRTSVENYLQPMVHEVKVSRADLLSDLRNAAKRESYQWLSCETYYVLPAGVAEPHEIPEAFGVWLLHGAVDTGTLELARTARHTTCRLPFSAWMALAKAIPVASDHNAFQRELGDTEDYVAADTDI